jgi:hypothetical protein
METYITLFKSSFPIEVKLDIRNKIIQAEEALNNAVSSGQVVDSCSSFPLRHFFTQGVYARELTIPAGQVIVGKIHKHEHLNFISKGKVTVLTEEGGLEELTAPCTIISPAGVKRLLYTHEETVWTVVHQTDKTNLDEIEDENISPCFVTLLEGNI